MWHKVYTCVHEKTVRWGVVASQSMDLRWGGGIWIVSSNCVLSCSELQNSEGSDCQCKKVCNSTFYKPSLSYSEIDPDNFQKYILTDQEKENALQVWWLPSILLVCWATFSKLPWIDVSLCFFLYSWSWLRRSKHHTGKNKCTWMKIGALWKSLFTLEKTILPSWKQVLMQERSCHPEFKNLSRWSW